MCLKKLEPFDIEGLCSYENLLVGIDSLSLIFSLSYDSKGLKDVSMILELEEIVDFYSDLLLESERSSSFSVMIGF